MTLPPVVRVFFAIDLPASLKDALACYVGELKKHTKPHAIRWSRPENLHITLQFLAEVQSQDLPSMVAKVKQALSQPMSPLVLHLRRLHVFPDPYRPRVIVMDVAPQAPLAALSKAIGVGIRLSQYETEDRPFHAHLTLGRIKQPQGMDLGFLAQEAKTPLAPLILDEVVLFRSEPQPEGSRYTPLERIPLFNK